MSQSVRLSSRARENIHSITNSHKKISSLNDLHRKICISQKLFVPLQPQSCKCFCHPNRWCKIGLFIEILTAFIALCSWHI